VAHSNNNDAREPVAILGATGAVGQRLVQLLADHPWFRAAELIASERSAGKRYRDAVTWHLATDVPADAGALQVMAPKEGIRSRLVLSALAADLAATREGELASAGHFVVSNASSHRMDGDVPLVIPEVNPDHLAAISTQRQRRSTRGAIVTNPNCATIGLAMFLAPVHRRFGVTAVSVVTLQALSGAGLPGVPALAALGNAIPHIPGEADKLENEPNKILGTFEAGVFAPAEFTIAASVHRVPVQDGHLMTVSLRLRGDPTPADVAACLQEFRGEPQQRCLPSAPAQPICVLDNPDRPQPLLDRDRGGGMTVTVGQIRACPVLGMRAEVLVHNTLRGAAGGTLLLAELARDRGLLEVPE